MKKILFMAFLAASMISCKKNDTVKEQTKVEASKNNMAVLMDDMMAKMHTAATGNNDADYSRMMIEHHKGAIDMSKLLLNEGKNPEMRSFAEKVMQDQGREIDVMQKFVSKNTKSPDTNEFHNALNASMSAMMQGNAKVYNNIDKDYAAQMIPHHQSAVEMAKAYLKFGKEPELVKLSNDIIKNQNAEISFLQNWLAGN